MSWKCFEAVLLRCGYATTANNKSMCTKPWTEDDSEGTSKFFEILSSNHLGRLLSVLKSIFLFFYFFRSSCNGLVVLKVYVICSIKASFTSLWKQWFEFWKC